MRFLDAKDIVPMRPTSHRTLAYLSATFAALLLSEAATAAPFVRTDAGAVAVARFGPPGTGDTINHFGSSDTGASLVFSSFAQQGASTGSADAAADLGALHAQAFATFPSSFITSEASGGATASWSDGFTVNIPGHAGEQGVFRGSVVLHGVLDAVGDALAAVNVSSMINGQNALGFRAFFDHNGLHDPNGIPLTALPQVLPFEVTFIIGTPFQVSMNLVASVAPLNDAVSGSGDALFRDTLTWGGIDSIRLQGTTINNFIFESLSGLDYTQSFVRDVPPSSVPEPSSAILLLAGIMLLWSRRRQLPVISRISSEAPDAAAC